jgi:hypothetical protein
MLFYTIACPEYPFRVATGLFPLPAKQGGHNKLSLFGGPILLMEKPLLRKKQRGASLYPLPHKDFGFTT